MQCGVCSDGCTPRILSFLTRSQRPGLTRLVDATLALLVGADLRHLLVVLGRARRHLLLLGQALFLGRRHAVRTRLAAGVGLGGAMRFRARAGVVEVALATRFLRVAL